MSTALLDPALSAATTTDLTSDAGAGSIIMVATQYIKFGLPEKGRVTCLYPLIPLILSIGWATAEEYSKNQVLNWAAIAARSFKIFIIAIGVYSVGKQIVRDKGKA